MSTWYTFLLTNARIRAFRNTDKNSQWDCEEINLSKAFCELFDEYRINYRAENLQEKILSQSEKKFFDRMIYLLKMTLQMRNSIPNTNVDYMISPVQNINGVFYDSRKAGGSFPENADANGAYNIARKGLWIIQQIKQAEDISKCSPAMTSAQWLEYAQTHPLIVE